MRVRGRGVDSEPDASVAAAVAWLEELGFDRRLLASEKTNS